MYIETRVPPLNKHVHRFFRYLRLGKKHFENPAPKNLFQGLRVKARRKSEHSIPIETTIGTENVKMSED
jgi:hypothetical protein